MTVLSDTILYSRSVRCSANFGFAMRFVHGVPGFDLLSTEMRIASRLEDFENWLGPMASQVVKQANEMLETFMLFSDRSRL